MPPRKTKEEMRASLQKKHAAKQYSPKSIKSDSLKLLFVNPDMSKESFDAIHKALIKYLGSNKSSLQDNWLVLNTVLKGHLKGAAAQSFRDYTKLSKPILANDNDHSEIVKQFQIGAAAILLDPKQIKIERALELLPGFLETKPPYVMQKTVNGTTHIWEQFKIEHFGNGGIHDPEYAKFLAARTDSTSLFNQIYEMLMEYSAKQKLMERGICTDQLNLRYNKLQELATSAKDANGDDADIHFYVCGKKFPDSWWRKSGHKSSEDFLKEKIDSARDFNASDLAGEGEDALGLEHSFLISPTNAESIAALRKEYTKSMNQYSPEQKVKLLIQLLPKLQKGEKHAVAIAMQIQNENFFNSKLDEYVGKDQILDKWDAALQYHLVSMVSKAAEDSPENAAIQDLAKSFVSILDDEESGAAAAPAPPYEVSELGGAAAAPAPYEAHELGGAAAIGEGDDGL